MYVSSKNIFNFLNLSSEENLTNIIPKIKFRAYFHDIKLNHTMSTETLFLIASVLISKHGELYGLSPIKHNSFSLF